MTNECRCIDNFEGKFMIDHYKLITVNHKVLNTEDLQHFIIRHNDDKELVEKLDSLKKAFGQEEVIYLNTCNRIIFLFYGTLPLGKESIQSFFNHVNPDIKKTKVTNLDLVVADYVGMDAMNHIMEVASSIDSLVIGEREIFRQFKQAYTFCRKHKLCSDKLRLVEQSTVRAAKDVYTNTSIGAKPVSVVSLSIQEFLKRDLAKDARILLIGAGETNGTVGRFLLKYKYENITIFNRSLDNAQKLSEELGADAKYLGELENYKEGFDCVFACTAAQDPILTLDIFNSINNTDNKKVLIDLSIPHNIASDVAALESVDYISIDTLRVLAEKNMQFRSGNISSARIILSTHLEEFQKLYERRKVEKALGKLPEEIGKVKDRALNLVYKDQIDNLTPEAQALINEIADYMEKKCVAVPMKLAKKMAN